MNSSKRKHWIGIRREPEGEVDRSKPGKGLLWRKHENEAKHGARFRGWRATESNGDASQMIYAPSGKKGYTTTTTKTTTTTTNITTVITT